MINLERYRGRRVLITGGLGFIGSNIAHKLACAGAITTLVDCMAPMYGGNLTNIAEIRDQVTLHVGDYRDKILMERLLRDTEIIFHLAAQVSYIDSSRIPFEDLDLNCRGTLQILELCREVNSEVRVVFASSRLVLGKIINFPVLENHPTEPLSLYGVHKLVSERYCKLYADVYGIKTAILRITNPYGERQQIKHSKYSLPGWFMRLAAEGKPIKIFGSGTQLRDYVYATDLADAFLAVGIGDIQPGDLFNCGFGQSVSFRQMAESIIRILGKGAIEYGPWPPDYEKVETGDVMIDIGKLKRMTGWSPKISLEEGIERMWQYYKSRLDLYI